MKKIFTAIATACVWSGLAFAQATPTPVYKVPAKSELAVNGDYFQAKGSKPSVWDFSGQMAFPVTQGGALVLGPQVVLSSDKNRDAGGVVLELNLLGNSRTTPYIGANGLYSFEHQTGQERQVINADAGVKWVVGKGGFIKTFASKIVDGRGKDGSNITGNLGIGLRW